MKSILLSSVILQSQEVKASATGIFATVDGGNSSFPPQVTSHRGTPDPSVKWACKGSIDLLMDTSGWDVLRLQSARGQGMFSDATKAYACGFLEGSVTMQQYLDYAKNQGLETTVQKSRTWFQKNLDHMEAKVMSFLKDPSAADTFTAQAALQHIFWKGIYSGMNSTGASIGFASDWDPLSFYMVTNLVDLSDVQALPSERRANNGGKEPREPVWYNDQRLTREEFELQAVLHSRCSSLVKLTESNDLFAGHDTWYLMNSMNRVYKIFDLDYEGVKSSIISFSSYPGAVASVDDFYVLENQMVVMETSITVMNDTLWALVQPESTLSGYRAMIANRLAVGGETWVNLFSMENSGTYNNEWLVVDYKKFTPSQNYQPDVLWVADQIPGRVEGHDQSKRLFNEKYFPSYNVPVYTDIFDEIGGPASVQRGGPQMNSYDDNVRGRIFKRDQHKVTDLESFRFMMQYNDYEHDPISAGNPLYAIASRVDLATTGGCFGALDQKATSYCMWHGNAAEGCPAKSGDGRTPAGGSKMVVSAYGAPTPQQSPFSWNEKSCRVPQQNLGMMTNYSGISALELAA